MATSIRTFYAYKVINETAAHSASSLRANLHQKLESNADSFGNRCKAIAGSTTTEDVLACFIPLDQTAGYVSGEMWRIGPSKGMPRIPTEMFEQTSVRSDEIPNDANVSPTDKSRIDWHFFLITNDRLVTTYPPSRINGFAKYLNELLAVYRGVQIYKFDPLIILPSDIKLSDISAISFNDRPILENGKMRRENSKFGLFKACTHNLRKYFDDFGNTNDLVNQKILSATMTLTLKKPIRMSDDVYQHKLSALLRTQNGIDADGVSFKLTNGKEIKAMEIHAKEKKVFNDQNEADKENVVNAYNFMVDFLNRL